MHVHPVTATACPLPRAAVLDTSGKEISASTHDATTWAAHFKGTVESYNTEGGGTSFLPNHLLGTTAEIEALRPKSPTQLREEASKKTLHEVRRAVHGRARA